MDPKHLEATISQAPVDVETSSEDALIERLGYEQQYRRVFKTFSNIAVAITFCSPIFGLLIIASYPITYGGYWGLTWGWIIPAILLFPQSLAVAELCSAMPTNGALYWWTAALAPPSLSRPLSFISGWIIFLSDVTVLASFSYATSSSYTLLISILQPEWSPTSPQKMAIAMAIVLCWVLINFTKMERLSMVFNGLAILALLMATIFIVGVPASHAVQHRPFMSAYTVFTQYTNYSDWDQAVAVPFTFFAPAFVIAGWQVPAYIVEETHNPRIAAPKAIITSYSATAVVSFLVCLVSAFCIDDMEALATDPSGFPLYTLLISNLGPHGGSAILLTIVTCTAIGGGALVFTFASQLAAFARDGGIPYSKTFAYVHPRSNMPFPAIMLISSVSFLLLLFSLSPIASSILYSLAVIALYMTIGLPIGLRLFAGNRFAQGPFNYGRYSWPIHAWALLTIAYIMVIECFPITPNWTLEIFNYNWCVALGAVLLATGLWFVYGRKGYQGVNLVALQTFRTQLHQEREDEKAGNA